MRTLYEILGIDKDADEQVIRRAYHRKARKYHPDRNPGDEASAKKYHDVQEAYEVLNDPIRRKDYDETGNVTKAAPKNEHGEIAGIIVPVLMDILNRMSSLGGTDRVKNSDMVKEIVSQIKLGIAAAEQSLNSWNRGLGVLKEAEQRFVVEAGEYNILSSSVRDSIRNTEAQIATIKRDLDRMTRALNYLKKCKYRIDDIVRDLKPEKVAKQIMGGWTKIS